MTQLLTKLDLMTVSGFFNDRVSGVWVGVEQPPRKGWSGKAVYISENNLGLRLA